MEGRAVFTTLCVGIMMCLESSVAQNVTALEATESRQNFTSVNYPTDYDNSVNHTWIIYTNYSDAQIEIEVLDILIEISQSCSNDNLTIYGGSSSRPRRLARLCGDRKTTVEVDEQWAMVIFTTDQAVTKRGFLIAYTAIREEEEEEEEGFNVAIVIGPIVGLFIVCTLCGHSRGRQPNQNNGGNNNNNSNNNNSNNNNNSSNNNSSSSNGSSNNNDSNTTTTTDAGDSTAGASAGATTQITRVASSDSGLNTSQSSGSPEGSLSSVWAVGIPYSPADPPVPPPYRSLNHETAPDAPPPAYDSLFK